MPNGAPLQLQSTELDTMESMLNWLLTYEWGESTYGVVHSIFRIHLQKIIALFPVDREEEQITQTYYFIDSKKS